MTKVNIACFFKKGKGKLKGKFLILNFEFLILEY